MTSTFILIKNLNVFFIFCQWPPEYLETAKVTQPAFTVPVSLFLTLNIFYTHTHTSSVSIVNFERVIAGWIIIVNPAQNIFIYLYLTEVHSMQY